MSDDGDDGRDPLAGLKSQLGGIRQSLHTVAAAPSAPDLRGPAAHADDDEAQREADIVANLDYRVTVLRGKRMGEMFDVGRIITFGRADNCEVQLDEIAVSREHCRVVYHPEKRVFLLQDLGSQNGTKLNGETARRAELASGDRIGVGSAMVMFHSGALPAEVREELEELRADEAAEEAEAGPEHDVEPLAKPAAARGGPETPTKTEVDPPGDKTATDVTATEVMAMFEEEQDRGGGDPLGVGVDDDWMEDGDHEGDLDGFDALDQGGDDARGEAAEPEPADDEDDRVETSPLDALDAAILDSPDAATTEPRPSPSPDLERYDGEEGDDEDDEEEEEEEEEDAPDGAADEADEGQPGRSAEDDAAVGPLPAAASAPGGHDEEDTDSDMPAMEDEDDDEDEPEGPDTERTNTPRPLPDPPPEETTGELEVMDDEGGSLLLVAAFFLGGVAVAFVWWFLKTSG